MRDGWSSRRDSVTRGGSQEAPLLRAVVLPRVGTTFSTVEFERRLGVLCVNIHTKVKCDASVSL